MCAQPKINNVNSSCNCEFVDSVSGREILPTGSIVRGLTVEAFLNQNGDSAVYLALDAGGQKVWLREFLPTTIAFRNYETLAMEIEPEYNARFQYFRASFRDMYTSMQHASSIDCFLPIADVFEENNTVYVVIPYRELVSLPEFLKNGEDTPPWCKAKSYLLPLFNGISNLHKKGIVHQGICPENIFLDDELHPYLLGLSLEEVRMAQGELETELFPGFSAPEQYNAQSWKGTWTDVYALAAVTYWVLTGVTPPDALSRLQEDTLIPAMEKDFTIAENISEAISKGLELNVEDRYQSVDEFTEKLLESISSNTAVFQVAPEFTTNANTVHIEPEEYLDEKTRSNRFIMIPMIVTLALLVAIVMVGYRSVQLLIAPTNPTENTDAVPEEVQEEKKYPVPNFVGLDKENILKDTQYDSIYTFVVVEEYDETIAEGRVISQTPKFGSEVPARTKVTLTVSKGSAFITMPNLYNASEASAKQQLEDLNINYKVVNAPNGDVNPGRVFYTQPASGTEIQKESNELVLLYVATAMPTVQEPTQSEAVTEPEDDSETSDQEEPEDSGKKVIRRKEKPEEPEEPFNPFIER